MVRGEGEEGALDPTSMGPSEAGLDETIDSGREFSSWT